MHLHRVTPDPFENYTFDTGGKYLGQSHEDLKASWLQFDMEPGRPVVKASFPRFGNGTKRLSDFEVLVEWSDVQTIIEKFCEAGHLEANAIREAVKLAAAAKDLGWREPQSLQSNLAPPPSGERDGLQLQKSR